MCPQNLRSRKLSEITLFYTVDALKNVVMKTLEQSQKKFVSKFFIKVAAVCFEQPQKANLS